MRQLSLESSQDNSSSDESEESPDEELSQSARFYVFFVLGLGVQAFLSYSGGATPTTVSTLTNNSETWTPIEIGLLGALDKVALVFCSPVWGWAFEHVPAKRLLSITLICNAAFTFQFGLLGNKYSMFFSRFMQGVTEAPNIIWGNLWTLSNAPTHLLSLWMNLGGVAAAIGTAVGLVVAGFVVARQLPYAYTYSVQAGVLFIFWILLISTPPKCINLPATPQAEVAGQKQRHRRKSTGEQIRDLSRNGLYILTMFNIGLILFVTSGNSFYWPQFFRAGPWVLRAWVMTLSNLVIPGIGMGAGIFFGPLLIDSKGGYQTDMGRYVTLHLLWQVTAVGALGAGLSMMALGWRMTYGTYGQVSLEDPALWIFWIATLPTNFALSAQVGVQTVINLGAVNPEMKELAQGVTTSFQNLFGYAGGVLGPSIVGTAGMWLSQFLSHMGLEEPDTWSDPEWVRWQLSVSFLVVFGMVYMLFFTLWASQLVARRRLEKTGMLTRV